MTAPRQPGQQPGSRSKVVPVLAWLLTALTVVIFLVVTNNHGQNSNAAAAIPTVPAATSPAVSPTPATKHHRKHHKHQHKSSNAAPSPVTSVQQPTGGSAGCYPTSDEGTCYQPGEYCRDNDHGVTGVAGDGETITCEYNDGWRWEPA
jgi:hypothetical protein